MKDFFKKVGQQIKSFFTNIQQSVTVITNIPAAPTQRYFCGLVKVKTYSTVSSTVSTPPSSKNRLVASTTTTMTGSKASVSETLDIVAGNVTLSIEPRGEFEVGPPPTISLSVQNANQLSIVGFSTKDTWNLSMTCTFLVDGVGTTSVLECNKILFAAAAMAAVMCPAPVLGTLGSAVYAVTQKATV